MRQHLQSEVAENSMVSFQNFKNKPHNSLNQIESNEK